MQRSEAIKRAFAIPGQCWPRELATLYDLCKGSTCHVEIGSYCGRSLFTSAMSLAHGAKLFAVDPLLPLDSVHLMPSESWWENVLSITLQTIREHRPDLQVRWFRCGSLEAAREIDGIPDTVYIDGNHNYAEVCADIGAWSHAKKLFGHDYWSKDPGVMDAVNELCEEFVIVPDTRIWQAVTVRK